MKIEEWGRYTGEAALAVSLDFRIPAFHQGWRLLHHYLTFCRRRFSHHCLLPCHCRKPAIWHLFPLPLANAEFSPTMAFTMSMNPFNWFIHQVQASTILPLPSMGRMVTQKDCDHYPIQDLSQRLPGGVGCTAVLVHQEGTGYISNILLLPTLCIIISKSQLSNLINLLVTDGS